MPEEWSARDRYGVCTRALAVGALSTLRAKRLRRAFPDKPAEIAIWPASWRELLAEWIKTTANRRKWETLLGLAGNLRAHIAHDLLEALLRGGWVELEEKQQGGGWLPVWVEFLQLTVLRHVLGIPDSDVLDEQWRVEAAQLLNDDRLEAIKTTLAAFAPQKALIRLELLRALDAWIGDARFGTRRDFAQYARGDTKSITTAEWDWLGGVLELAALGIERHIPALWLRAPLRLNVADVCLDLRLVDDCIGLTPSTVRKIGRIEPSVECWRVVENRTSFERAAREHGARDGVVWLPGFPPSWWREAVAHLITLEPAPALVACDPDPAGIEIALQCGSVWEACGLGWEPWLMDAATLADYQRRRPLNEADRDRLQHLCSRALPPALRDLAAWMLQHGEKGEQEQVL